MPVHIRAAVVEDLQFVYEVTQAAMRSYVEATFGPWVPSFQREVIEQSCDPATHQVILVDGDQAGILATQWHDTHVQLEKLYLMPGFQGLASSHRCFENCSSKQQASAAAKPIRLRVLVVNVGAQRLYERLGFVVASTTAQRVFMELHPS